MPKRTEVPASFVAFQYQALRFFARLLDSEEGDCIYLEHYDDVAQKKKQNILIREQVKFYTTQNPASDWATPFWHTLSNWIQILKNGTKTTENLKFVYCCSCSKPVGTIINQYHAARSIDQAEKAIIATKKALASSTLKQEKKSEISRIIDSQEFPKLVANFEFIQEDRQIDDIIKKKINKMIPIPGQAEFCRQKLFGWIVENLINQFHNGQIMCIKYEEFWEEYKSIWNALKADPLSAYASNYVLSLEDKKRFKNNIFIRQLELIDLKSEDQEEAILNYIRAQHMCAKMAKAGAINAVGYEQFKEDIKTRWKDTRGTILVGHPTLEKKGLGRMIYHQTMLLETNSKLQNQNPPRGFFRGICHDLSDNLDIGWHPDFLLEIKKDD